MRELSNYQRRAHLWSILLQRVADNRRRQSEHGVGAIAEVCLVSQRTCRPAATRKAVPFERRTSPGRVRRAVVTEAALQRAAEWFGGAEQVMSVGSELELVGRRGCGGCCRGVVEMHGVRVSGSAGASRDVVMMVDAAGEVHRLLMRWRWRRRRQAVRRREVRRLKVGCRSGGVGGGVTETVSAGHRSEAAGSDIAAQLVQRTAEVSPILHIEQPYLPQQ